MRNYEVFETKDGEVFRYVGNTKANNIQDAINKSWHDLYRSWPNETYGVAIKTDKGFWHFK